PLADENVVRLRARGALDAGISTEPHISLVVCAHRRDYVVDQSMAPVEGRELAVAVTRQSTAIGSDPQRPVGVLVQLSQMIGRQSIAATEMLRVPGRHAPEPAGRR